MEMAAAVRLRERKCRGREWMRAMASSLSKAQASTVKELSGLVPSQPLHEQAAGQHGDNSSAGRGATVAFPSAALLEEEAQEDLHRKWLASIRGVEEQAWHDVHNAWSRAAHKPSHAGSAKYHKAFPSGAGHSRRPFDVKSNMVAVSLLQQQQDDDDTEIAGPFGEDVSMPISVACGAVQPNRAARSRGTSATRRRAGEPNFSDLQDVHNPNLRLEAPRPRALSIAADNVSQAQVLQPPHSQSAASKALSIAADNVSQAQVLQPPHSQSAASKALSVVADNV
eukprot:CAMPEP_0178400478 /NCGR_PEP_ID=MMETSP0689_2-20121128/15810_1 /TAXON_ID=160604 /ORGANISM="Amphidinium massartii, Strain CS-259" /LENGTH=281 /DNA_ID=CAMNT_0020021275 /DNA_START=180 /DNA_END=1021 /DNA_ORIENTATION=-